jgi:hypothetical protein
MTQSEFLEKILIPLLAAFLGAILAFRYQHKMELRREKRYILQTLMMYRNVGADELDWIKALNAIDLVYMNHPKVIELYHTFIAYTQPEMFATRQYMDVFYNLLYEMGQCSGHKKLTLAYIRDYYAPEALNLHYPNRNVGNAPA